MMRYAVPAAAATVVATGLIHQATGGGLVPTLPQLALPASMALSYSALGALILVHRPGHRVGRLMTVIGGFATLAVLAVSWPGWAPAAWVAQWAWWPPIGLIPVLLLFFPDERGRRPYAIGLTLTALLPAVALALATLPGGRPLLEGAAFDGTPLLLLRVAWAGIAATALGMIGVLIAMARRFRAAGLPDRRRLLCAGAAGVTVLLGELLDTAGVPVAWIAEGVALPLALTVAILRLGLYDLDVYVNRAVVWLLLSAGVTGAYIVIVVVVHLPPLALAALVATCFEPARRLLQRAIDRLLFGHRDDPYAVLSRLGRHLEEVVAPAAALPRLVAAITDELRVPYAAIRVPGVLIDHGRVSVPPVGYPLITHRQQVGELLVSPRRAGDTFTRSERRLLRALARQAAVAVEAYRLTLDLQRSRERIVLAREEERRRLRTDLHDGLGPGLAGIAMQVRAVRAHADPAGRRLLDQLVGDLSSCSAELRGLVDDLHPPALDDGLPVALRREAARMSSGPVAVDVDCPADLGVLPAAVEVAALRIVAEAVTNAVKHSRGSLCTVVVRRRGPVDNPPGRPVSCATFPPTHKGGGGGGGVSLELIIFDDGIGMPGQAPDCRAPGEPASARLSLDATAEDPPAPGALATSTTPSGAPSANAPLLVAPSPSAAAPSGADSPDTPPRAATSAPPQDAPSPSTRPREAPPPRGGSPTAGTRPHRSPGVGLGSMRERAEELCGTCTIERAHPRGTRITARLPIAHLEGVHDAEGHLAGLGAVGERPVPARLS